jgi:DNA repair exonuclease SbcCD nuclease subunit
MVKFLHTADWQIGKSFSSLDDDSSDNPDLANTTVKPDLAQKLRAARLDTARDVMQMARDEDVDFVLIAGDLFEEEFAERSLRVEVYDILTQDDNPPVYVVAGNHDPIQTGCVYHQSPFDRDDGQLHIPDEPTAYDLPNDDGVLLTSPLTERKSNKDPCQYVPDSDTDGHRIGVTHGQLRIEGKYNDDAHPISLDAVAEHDLDYLALGDWHTHYEHPDHPNRCRYSGTQEQGKFSDDAGVLIVEMDEPGDEPVVEYRETGQYKWETLDDLDLTPEGSVTDLRNRLDQMEGETTLLKLIPEGTLDEEKAQAFQDLMENARNRFPLLDVDKSQLHAPVAVETLLDRLGSEELLTGAVADLLWLKTKMDPGAAADMPDVDASTLSDEVLDAIYDDLEEHHESLNGDGTDVSPEDIDRAVQELHKILEQRES